DIHAQYDLKGSLHGRILMPEEAAKPRACLKDQNWLNNGIKLQLGPAKRREFVEQLIRDVELLIKLRIMDYSLLVGIHDIQRGNHGKIRNATLSVFDPEKTQIPDKPYPQMTRANTIRDKVARTDPMVLDRLAKGDYPALPESMFRELTYSKFYCDNGGYLATDKNDQPTNMIYYLGVIDILTPYNAIKRMEHVARSVRYYDRHTISAVNPRYYGLRFLKFIIEGIGNSDDVRPLLEGFENRQRRMHHHRFHWGGGGG
ncbi:Phosphatidylinositol-4-phosphate 5-kinase, partial [Spiromyces aspiralis]